MYLRSFVLLAVACFVPRADAALWATVGSRGESTSLSAVDADTFLEVEGIRLVWIYFVSSDENGFVESVLAMRHECDCRRHEWVVRQWTEYSPKTLEIEHRGTSDDKFSAPDPRTAGVEVLDFVCGYDIQRGRPGQPVTLSVMDGKGIEAVVAIARDYFATWAADRARKQALPSN